MTQALGGIISTGEPHLLGDDCCSHCLPFPDPDYTMDVALMTKRYVDAMKEQDKDMEELASRIRTV